MFLYIDSRISARDIFNNQENIENHKEFQVVRPRKSFSKKRKDQCNKYGLRPLIKKENCLQQFETQNRFNVLIPEDEQRQVSVMEEVKKQINSNLKKCRRGIFKLLGISLYH